MTHIIRKTKYDKTAFDTALSTKEYLSARYSLEKKVSTVFNRKSNTKTETTTYYLHQSNVVVVAVKRFWCWITFQNFDKSAYNISEITYAIQAHFCQNFVKNGFIVKPENPSKISDNLYNLSERVKKASEQKPELQKIVSRIEELKKHFWSFFRS